VLLFVTGTGTDVGKTVVTAALAACLPGRVAVVKPAQTGVAEGEPGDLAEVTRLSGVTDVHEFVRYPDPLSPHQAARRAGSPYLDVKAAGERIVELEETHDVVIVEGAGGLLVPYDEDGSTLVDLMWAAVTEVRIVLVTLAGLGTLNHTALTLEHLAAQSLRADIVIGRWPAEPDLAMLMNVDDLARMSLVGRLAGAIPEGAPARADFRERAREWLAPALGGTFDAGAFRRAARDALNG
jgi:dethiobiotin synthetase